FFSMLGCFAYFCFEILPELMGRREVRVAKAAAVRKMDPERGLRAAREALETTDTAANRIALADSLAELDRWGEAVPHYRQGIAKAPAPERGVQMRLARALFEAGQVREARDVVEGLPETNSRGEADRSKLLLARILEELCETAKALVLYHEVGERLPGAEAQCREAALLIHLGRRRDAIVPLEEVERRLKRIDPHERASNRDMYDWAARTLMELRSE
ncbi:MAG TPA: tetratricopeptide repeat protein, partial [Allosphingosinicella sp.]